eukprot:1142285-Pelagomonas_calceolata.AAC.5
MKCKEHSKVRRTDCSSNHLDSMTLWQLPTVVGRMDAHLAQVTWRLQHNTQWDAQQTSGQAALLLCTSMNSKFPLHHRATEFANQVRGTARIYDLKGSTLKKELNDSF